ncbi:YjfB family protein [Paenibacillus sp. FSL R7-0273]|uniref:YjfB family protein n=1 Tax=Paenibacillus sp. FSL R7-0273 TaxID=1536772 RepID=UPI0009712DE4|nr:YjfB family protein [Paenibacillus sp. FSL R7-0273]OMF93977.1 putative motility protein [Paenibacillus sp. FSL R7-0273]
MDVAALSIAMGQASLKQAAGLQVMSIAKNTAEVLAQNMAQMLQQSPHPDLGKTLDIQV